MAQNDTTAILKGIYPKISAALKTNMSKYKQNIGKFMNARHTELYDNAPYTRMYWSVDDVQAFWKSLKLDQKVIANELSKTYYAKMAAFNPRCAKDPFTVAQLMYKYLIHINCATVNGSLTLDVLKIHLP